MRSVVRLFSGLTETGQDLWRSRYLLYQLIRRDIRIRYKQAVMGFAWAILMPIVVILSGLVVRSVVSHLSDVPLDTANISGLMVKSVPWSFFVGALGFATNSIAGNQVLVTKVYFPRSVLPIASVAAVGFDTLIGSIAVIAVLPFLGVQLSLALLWVPVLVLLLGVFTLACGLLFSSANVFFRDVKYLVQVLVTFGIFFTPVFFEPAMLGSAGTWAMMNPIAPPAIVIVSVSATDQLRGDRTPRRMPTGSVVGIRS